MQIWILRIQLIALMRIRILIFIDADVDPVAEPDPQHCL
jgi:hypothetical protein